MAMGEKTRLRGSVGRTMLCAAAWAAVGSGCAEPANDAPSERETEVSEPLALQAGRSAEVLRNPEGVYFAEVTANGTGCPAGSWQTSLAPDGQTFTTTFSAYEAMVDPNTTVSIKDCQLAVKLHSPQGLSYSVSSFYYSGYAYLEQGVSGRQFASYYFQGNPVQSAQERTTLVGPYDDTFLFTDQVGIADAVVWSPCGVERDLNIATRLRLLNSSPRRTGYMNVAVVDASTKLVFQLSWRSCEVDAGAPADAGVTLDAGGATDAGQSADAGRPRRRPRF